MTGNSIQVSAEWALHGKGAEGEGYRLLSCSNGDLSRANFEDALGRFSLGVPETLPQVSVSYLLPAGRHPGGSYLALAIDWFAAAGQHFANGAVPHDEHGRKTAFTSYFCAPYRPLAEYAVTYQDMYRTFSKVTVPASDGPPQPVTIQTSAAKTPAIDGLAMYVAPLLLTGKPVCVLDADGTSVGERLRFIDTVMALLPYGFRTRMTAATWAKSTYQNHRFRLYFSNAPRTDQQDHKVSWAMPDDVYLRGQAKEYFDWLADKVDPLNRLASLSELKTDLRFDNTALTKALELVDSLQGRRRIWSFGQYLPQPPRPSGGDVPQPPTPQPAPGPQPAPLAPDEIAEVLRECAEYIAENNTARLKSAANWLVKQAKADSLLKRRAEVDPALKGQAEAVDQRRKRYRSRIKEYGLLRPHGLGTRDKDLYAALLEVAFGRPLSYLGYCQVEQCLGGQPDQHPHAELLHVIRDGEMAFETKAIVLYLTRQERNEKELNKWYGSGELDAAQLVRALAQDWGRPHHARVIADFTLDFLKKAPTRYDQEKLRTALHQQGFLAHALHMRHPDKEQYQISALTRFIRAAYPGSLSRQAIGQILTGAHRPPTPALLAAVLMNASAPGDVTFALEAYLHGSLTRMNMHRATHDKLHELIPSLDSAFYTGNESAPGRLADPAQPAEPPSEGEP